MFLPVELPAGDYELDLALLDPLTGKPGVKLAIDGRETDGWYRLGKIEVREKSDPWSGGKFPPP